MMPKPFYEVLPVLYIVAGVLTLVMNDSWIRFFPAILLFLSAAMVIYMRYEFRHLSPKERAQRIAQKFRDRRGY